ncbi:MAG: phage tail protein [Gammaproteobacteria bacterium]
MARTHPYSAFNFIVEFNGSEPLGGFSDVSGLNTEITIAEYRNGNSRENYVQKVPGLNKTGDVTLKRGIVNSEVLWTWITNVRNESVDAKVDTMVVTLLSESRTPVQKWLLRSCTPIKYTGPTLAAKGGTDVAMEELVVSAQAIEIELS